MAMMMMMSAHAECMHLPTLQQFSTLSLMPYFIIHTARNRATILGTSQLCELTIYGYFWPANLCRWKLHTQAGRV